MESKCLPDKPVDVPPVPIKTYQWEDLRRARDAGGYPWTHLLKPVLEGEVTAEDVLRESTPRRSMSREVSRDRSRTRSPSTDVQRILNLDSSPGSSRKIGEDGEEQGIHIPNFSKEVSLDLEEDPINDAVNTYIDTQTKGKSELLVLPDYTTSEIPKNISPKGILKRRVPELTITKITETREKTKCCHPLVNKIKHITDKTLQKLEKSPNVKRKKHEEQTIVQLKSSPGAVRRQKFGAIKLGDSDEMSKTLSIDNAPPARKKREHIYEDIEQAPNPEAEKSITFSSEISEVSSRPIHENENSNYVKDNDNFSERKSNASQDPSLQIEEEDNQELKPEEHIMESLHKNFETSKEALVLEVDSEEPEIEDIIQNQLAECYEPRGSPNITITEITDDPDSKNPTPLPGELEQEATFDQSSGNKTIHRSEVTNDWSKPNRWTSEGGAPRQIPLRPTREGSIQSITPDVRCACQFFQSDSLLPERLNPVGTRPTSRASNAILNISDHEYEIIGKPPPDIVFTTPTIDQDHPTKPDDELSSTTSLERKYLQHASDDEDHHDDKSQFDSLNRNEISSAEALQKDLEDRYFVNTPSTVSRTECEISTSQVDSSALENLPLKRENRQKNTDVSDSKLHQRFREQTGKLKAQAGRLKNKLQNIKTSKFSMPDKSMFHLPQMPERSKFSLPDKRKFSLPERPKFKKINISEKLSFSDRKKFTMPDRPKFTMPDMPKFKIPEMAKINFSSLGRKKECKVEHELVESSEDITNIATMDFESRTYPRVVNRKKKGNDFMSSSPTLNRSDTPPPAFSFAKMSRNRVETGMYQSNNTQEPREYGNLPRSLSLDHEGVQDADDFVSEYDFDKLEREYDEENRCFHEAVTVNASTDQNTSSMPDVSSVKPEWPHVINEINNDEFFVRPKGISRENIQVRQYLSDEIREAFKMPSNSLALMDNTDVYNHQNDEDADPELYLDDESEKNMIEDIDKDDGYYTFPPVRPSRAKRMRKELESVEYIDRSMNASIQFSEVELEINNAAKMDFITSEHVIVSDITAREPTFTNSQTLPSAPKRKKKSLKSELSLTSLNDNRRQNSNTKQWREQREDNDNIIVYRTEHEYIVPDASTIVTDQSPLPPRRSRNRSRSSHGTSFGDDDRTSHGAESLTLDPNISMVDQAIDFYREDRQESPGYATVDKYSPSKIRRSKSKTPPVRRRKSHSSERKYYTVDRVPKESSLPDRPPRKKSSTSLMTLNSFKRGASSGDITQYMEIEEHGTEEIHKDLNSGEIISKMKDRPLPPPPRPPRGPKKCKENNDLDTDDQEQINKIPNGIKCDVINPLTAYPFNTPCETNVSDEVVEIEVSTQTDPLPDDIDYELGIDDQIDISMSSSLRDIVDDDFLCKSQTKLAESPRGSRPTSRSDKALQPTDPKIQELSKTSLGRTSPTVILVERRVSSPTRINEREEIVTEASLTVQPIDIDESAVPEVPPLPQQSVMRPPRQSAKNISSIEDKALEKISSDVGQVLTDVQLDNLVTQRLQVRDLDVGRLNVSELQASKILVSEIEGMTLQVTELDSKSGHISVSGIELSPTVIDEIVKKFAELATTNVVPSQSTVFTEPPRPMSREEQTQTDEAQSSCLQTECNLEQHLFDTQHTSISAPPPVPPIPSVSAETPDPPMRPPPPDLTPLLYSYLQDLSIPPASFYQLRAPRQRPFTEFFESQHSAPPPPTRRSKRKPVHQSETSSEEDKRRPSPRRMPPPSRFQEPSITEAGVQFFRVCQNSISRTVRGIFNSLMSYVSGSEDKKDVQMALVIFLVLIAGLIMFGLSDGRTVHHHHWEFFNPPDGNNK